MSSLKNKNIILKDMVNEATILREFKFYGCEEVQGKVYGYNPVTKKCVDITGYDGPDAPPGYSVDSSVAAVSKKSFKLNKNFS